MKSHMLPEIVQSIENVESLSNHNRIFASDHHFENSFFPGLTYTFENPSGFFFSKTNKKLTKTVKRN